MSPETLSNLRGAVERAEDELRVAAAKAERFAELPVLRERRDSARGALAEAEAEDARERSEVERERARVAADQVQAAAEAKRARVAAEAEETRAALERELAPHLVELERASSVARDVNASIATAEKDRARLDVAELVGHILERADRCPLIERTRGVLAGEAIASAAVKVEAIDPQHTAARAARERVKALEVHGQLAEIEEVRALAAGARAALRATLERVASSRSPTLALAAIMSDASTDVPVPPVVHGIASFAWLGTSGTHTEAMTLAARSSGARPSDYMPVEELGELVMAGRGDEAMRLGARRREETERRRLADATDGTGFYTCAVAEWRALRFDAESVEKAARLERIRAIVGAAAESYAAQIRTQLAAGVKRPFMVRSPGALIEQPLDDLSRALAPEVMRTPWGAASSVHPATINRRSPPAEPRAQLIARLGITDLEELHELVPALDVEADAQPNHVDAAPGCAA